MELEKPLTIENIPLWKRMTLHEIWEKLDKQYPSHDQVIDDLYGDQDNVRE